MVELPEDDIYKINIILNKNKMKSEYFYNITNQLNITNRKIEYRMLRTLISLPKKDIIRLAEEIKHLKENPTGENTDTLQI